jgi:hypothetical protein
MAYAVSGIPLRQIDALNMLICLHFYRNAL